MDELLKNHLFAVHAIAGAGSVTVGSLLTYPLDTLKTLAQVGSASGKQPLSAAQIVDRVRTLSGTSGLYSGFGWSILARISGLGARFGVYEILTAFYKDGREDNYVYVSEAFIAGMVAGAVESVISSPFEMIKVRKQVTSASLIPSSSLVAEKRVVVPSIARLLNGYTPDQEALNYSVGLLSTLTSKHHNMIGALQKYPWMMTGSGRPPHVFRVSRPSDVISLEGWGALWRGLRSGLVRDSIFGGVFFSTWQFLHQAMRDWKAVGMDPAPSGGYEAASGRGCQNHDIHINSNRAFAWVVFLFCSLGLADDEIGPLSPLAVSLAAGFSGSVAAAASHSFDTAKSRSQCIVLPKYISLERKLLKWKQPGSRFERYSGIHPSDRSLLSRGIWLRVAAAVLPRS